MSPWYIAKEIHSLRYSSKYWTSLGKWSIKPGYEQDSWHIELYPTKNYEPRIGQVSLRRFAPNSSIYVSYDLSIREEYRRRGLSEKMFKLQLALLQIIGGTCLVATVKDDNEAQITRLTKLGWKRGGTVTGDEIPCDPASIWTYNEYI